MKNGFATGERKIISNGVERIYFVKLPAAYGGREPLPLIFCFHGASGTYANFTGGYYDFQSVVGDEAILVYPNGLTNAAGLTQWDSAADLVFFDDLLRELEARLCIDTNRVFAVGHSAGAGFVHTLGCRRGNVLRAIAAVAGTLLDHGSRIGRVAVIQIHGRQDQYVPLGMIASGRDYWIAVNGGAKGATHAGVAACCVAYEGCDPRYPVQYCEHDGGHDWPDFGSRAIWAFFKSLPVAAPSDETVQESAGSHSEGRISFKVRYPADFSGTPSKLALALYPHNTSQPISTAPSFILNHDIAPGDYTFGAVTAYDNIAIDLEGLDYGDYALTVTVYVEGGSYPIPTSGMDYQGLQNITIAGPALAVAAPFELAFVRMGF